MPETYSECMELKAEIKHRRTKWVIPLAEVSRLRDDWVRRADGYLDRARQDSNAPLTNESIRGKSELELARRESYAIRQQPIHSR